MGVIFVVNNWLNGTPALIVIGSEVTTGSPVGLSVLIVIVNVSAGSTTVSCVGVTEKLPVLLVINTLPELVTKSPALVTDQYNRVLLSTFKVFTVIISGVPSFTDSAAGTIKYSGINGTPGPWLVSIIDTEVLVATGSPVVLPVKMFTINDSGPSLVTSSAGVTENVPVLLLIVTKPVLTPKSPTLAGDTAQDSIVLLLTLVVLTVNDNSTPSLTALAPGITE